MIKNKKLLLELERKVRRILYYETRNPDYFEQKISGIRKMIIKEIEEQGRADD